MISIFMKKVLSASPYFWEQVKGVNLAQRHKEGKLSFLLLNQPPLCDSSCRRCFMPPSRRTLAQGDNGALAFEEWKGVIHEGKKKGLLSIELSGEGEPLLSGNTVPLIEYASSQGVLATLITNGHSLTNDDLKRLMDSRGTLVFSLHTLDEKKYESDNDCPGSFRLKMEAIEKAAKAFRDTGYPWNGFLVRRLALHVTLQADNLEEVEGIRAFCHERGIFFSIAPLADTGNAVLHPEIRVDRDVGEVALSGDNSIIHSATSKSLYGREVCGTAAFGMSIGFDGNLLLDAHGGYEIGNVLGNVRTSSFEELLNTWRGVVGIMFDATKGFCPVRDTERFGAFVRGLKR
jgi:MoaA/NifB/PqqE/SkfB family radical SAM enzyme